MENLFSKEINKWLNSGEYLVDIDDMRTRIMKESAMSNSESTTASVFENELYYLIKFRTGLELNIIKEQNIDGINHTFGNLKNRNSGNGRLDAVVNNLIIEYKHYSRLSSNKDQNIAIEQVKDYLKALSNKESIKYNAILTDGIKICYFSFLDNEIHNTNICPIENEDIDTIIRAILANNTKKFVPENILKDFSINPIVPSISKSVAQTLYKALKDNKTEKTNMLSNEWKALMHLSVDDNGKGNDIEKRRKDLSLIFSDNIDDAKSEYDALYALQTTYAIIVKLIACKVVDKLEYNDATKSYYDLSKITSSEMQIFFEKMEDGYSYKSNNITNFLEGDFFSWYSDKEQWNNEFWKYIVEIVKCIDQYSAFSLNVYYEPIDIFKDLYMSIIPKSIRHSMGEYFTPKWLADYVISNGIENIENKDEWKAIDPCCGSGIFLLELIKKIVGDRNIKSMSNNEKKELKEKILNRVYGIDINPLSVLSARVGYYLALKPLGTLKDVEIPVYLGDSAILADKILVDNIECYKYSITNLKEPFNVILPIRYVKLSDFGQIMSELQACVKTEDVQILSNVIKNKLNEDEKASKKLMNCIDEMAQKLVMLHSNHWDGIWIRIATNFMLIARLSNFDLIVGNPPWVKWEHLPTMYAKKIKELCDIKHIFSGAGQYGGTQLNICALISNVTATNWLSEKGMLIFLMPDSIMSQNSYEGFRNFYLDYSTKKRLYLQKIDRWRAPLRPFRSDNKVVTQDFNTYYFSRKIIDYFDGIPVIDITRKKDIKDDIINNANNFKEAQKYLKFSDYKAVQLSKNTTAFSYTSKKYDYSKIIGPTDYLYRTGVEFTPQQLYMLKGLGKSEKDNYYKFTNKDFSLSKYKIQDQPKDGWNFPTTNIYPIITGPNIEAFNYNSNNEYCILPYTKDNTNTPIPSDIMLKENKDILIYLANHKELIDKQSEKSKQMHRGKEFYALSKIGPYTFADYIVAARDNSKFCASVIKKETTPWNEEKQVICVKHTIIISQDKNNRFINEDEAYYICGILNSEIVQQYIQTTFKSNGFSLNKSNLYMPLYDQNNKNHKQIVEIAKFASTNKGYDLLDVQNKLMILYLAICDEKKI
jgi:hypothetical protein